MAYKHKEDQAKAAQKHYAWNKAIIKARARAHNKITEQKIRALIREKKNVPCMDCQRCYFSYVMDFDHVRGIKKFTISQEVCRHSILKILEEIEKCEVVCSNCHRIRTHNRRVAKV